LSDFVPDEPVELDVVLAVDDDFESLDLDSLVFDSLDFDSLGFDSDAFVSLGLLSPFDSDEPPSDDFDESPPLPLLPRCAFLP
jgi:hypothetical protein